MAEKEAGDLRLDALVANGTMSPAIAATLKSAIVARRSFVVIAIPRMAGKTTVMRAMLAELPKGTPVKTLATDGDEPRALLKASAGGYFVVPEISNASEIPGYISGAPVRAIFATLPPGTSMATALHAPGAAEALEIICGGNGVPAAHAAKLGIAVYIRSLGTDWQKPLRRVVATVHEIEPANGARPRLRLLHRWDEARDRFDDVAKPGWA